MSAAVLDLCDAKDAVKLCAWVGALSLPPTVVHKPGMAEEMFDRQALENALADLEKDASEETRMDVLQTELGKQAQARWVDETIPALDGLTPRQAAADPTRREQLNRLLNDIENRTNNPTENFNAITMDVSAIRTELDIKY